jgi:hypothetical protein
MNVTDLPLAVSRELYDEAASMYAQLVQPRAIAVYKTGNVHYPGLSDLDLIVVTDRTGIDNRYFFSAMQRMPRRYLSIFLHEPFILPAWSMRVMQHTTHGAPVLLGGRDVLSPYPPSAEEAERWCRMLESYCSYSRFAATVRERDALRGRLTVAVASAYRFLLADAGDLAPRHAAVEYAATIDGLRAHFFERDPEEGVREAWRIFSGHFDAFDATMREWLGVVEPQAALNKARALLRGEEACDAFDREYAFRRARSIDGYHQELASLGFPYGHLFFIAAHPGAVYRGLEPSPVTNLVRQFYRVRRRLAEYAAGA